MHQRRSAPTTWGTGTSRACCCRTSRRTAAPPASSPSRRPPTRCGAWSLHPGPWLRCTGSRPVAAAPRSSGQRSPAAPGCLPVLLPSPTHHPPTAPAVLADAPRQPGPAGPELAGAALRALARLCRLQAGKHPARQGVRAAQGLCSRSLELLGACWSSSPNPTQSSPNPSGPGVPSPHSNTSPPLTPPRSWRAGWRARRRARPRSPPSPCTQARFGPG